MIEAIGGICKVAKAGASLLKRAGQVFGWFEEKGISPVSNKRKANLQDKRIFEQNMENMALQNGRFNTTLDAMLQEKLTLMAEGSRLSKEAMRKQLGESFTEEQLEEAIFTRLRAIDNFYKETLEGQRAKESIAGFAIQELEKNPAPDDVGRPTPTWDRRFLKYASDILDEDAQRLWGRILAGELSKPGSFSLKTLEILYTLETENASEFAKIAPHMMCGSYAAVESVMPLDVDHYPIKTLESLGLLMLNASRVHESYVAVENRHYAAIQKNARTAGQQHQDAKFLFNCISLTQSGSEILKIVDISKQDSLAAMQGFARVAKQRHNIDMLIVEGMLDGIDFNSLD